MIFAEFLVTILAVLLGLMLGKQMSRGLAYLHVPIAAGNPEVA